MSATLTTLASIGASDSNLIADANGDLFGTSNGNGVGSVFEIVKTASGYASTATTLATFDFDDGYFAAGGLFADAEGNLLGVTRFGGAVGGGTVFEIAKTAGGYASTPTDLFSFQGPDGEDPQGSLIADANGDLFGTTTSGGANNDGTVYEIKKTAGGYASTPTTLVSFDGADGEEPIAGLVADSNGDLFGTTAAGGPDEAGTVFEIAKTQTGYASTPTTLVNFNITDGSGPFGSLIIDSRGDLFGTTSGGGENDDGTPADGTVFEIKRTVAGYATTPITLVSFDGVDAFSPGNLIADANGDLFGTTPSGFTVDDSAGTVFEILNTPVGYASAPSILVDFNLPSLGANGSDPVAGLFADANGDLFGTTSAGENDDPDSGTVFEITDSGFATTRSVTPPTVTSNILWQKDDWQAAIWDMNGNTLVGGGTVSPNPGPNWFAIGTGDFDDDGHSDILWQNASGQGSIWEMNGNTLIGGGPVSPNPGPNWFAIGTGDFNDDHHSDILWQNDDGQAAIWEMNGNNVIGGGAVSPNPGPSWFAVGTGDFNKDGDSDILWQNANTGQVSIWEMSGNKIIGGGKVSPNPGPSWQAIGTGDFNHDGFSDILFQNTSTGQVSVWEMDGNSLIGGGSVANPGTSWFAVGTGGGGSDILLQNASGQASIWEMNGNKIIGGGPVSPNPGPSWFAVGLT